MYMEHGELQREVKRLKGEVRKLSGIRSPEARIPKRDKPERKNIGSIKVKGSGLLNLPRNKWPKGEQLLCDVCMNEKSEGCKNPRFTKSHYPVEMWPKVAFDFVRDHVQTKHKLNWFKETLKKC